MQLGHGENNLWLGEYFNDNDVTIACILCYDLFSSEIALSNFSCSFFFELWKVPRTASQSWLIIMKGKVSNYFFSQISVVTLLEASKLFKEVTQLLVYNQVPKLKDNNWTSRILQLQSIWKRSFPHVILHSDSYWGKKSYFLSSH